jgi:hypothetical protein
VLGNRFDVGFGTGTVRLGDDRFGTEVISSPHTLPPAKFTVKTQISDECLSSPLCKVITERDITEDVYEFISVSNKYNHVSNFPGSNLSRILIFDSDYYFRYGLHQVEAFTDSKIFPKDNHGESIKVNIEYHNCSVYLKPGQEVNCIITIKPYDEPLVEKNSTTQ